MREVRALMDELYLPLQPLYGPLSPAAAATADITQLSAAAAVIGMELPANVHLATLEASGDHELLVRLAHQFAVGEDAELSQSVSVDLFALLAPFQPKSAEELTLSANQAKAEQLAAKIQWPTVGQSAVRSAAPAASGKSSLRKAATTASSFVVELQPMQVKTFRVQTSA
jgi:leucyl-tRNA synthetase